VVLVTPRNVVLVCGRERGEDESLGGGWVVGVVGLSALVIVLTTRGMHSHCKVASTIQSGVSGIVLLNPRTQPDCIFYLKDADSKPLTSPSLEQ
jgi:hypothetical protein